MIIYTHTLHRTVYKMSTGDHACKQGRSQAKGLGGLSQREIVFRGAKHCYLNARQDDEAWRLHGQPASRGAGAPPAPLLAPPLMMAND